MTHSVNQLTGVKMKILINIYGPAKNQMKAYSVKRPSSISSLISVIQSVENKEKLQIWQFFQIIYHKLDLKSI